VPIGVANVVRPGKDYTIVTLGRMLHEALKAAETLKGIGLSTRSDPTRAAFSRSIRKRSSNR
jgi:transketolase C-terminal domain/subunit